MINVNKVYETVLTILNKEQRGYLDSTEFNNIASLVQREIFESYFLKMNAAPGGESDYSDPDKIISEKISYFEKTSDINELDSDNFTTFNARPDLSVAGDDSRINTSFFFYPEDFYRLGVVTTSGIIIDQVSHKDAAYLRLSHLTSPTAKQPIFVREEEGIKVFPNDDVNGINIISMNYVKEPTDPIWGFNLNDFTNLNEVNYDSSASTDFELHPSEEHELVIRILAYAGVTVRAPEITAFAQQVEQKIGGTEA